MHTFLRWLGVVLVAGLVAYGVTQIHAPQAAGDKAASESILQRVQRTKTLTCAYWPWPYLIERDPNTGAMSGAFVDVMQKVAEGLGVQIKWQSEANIDDFIQMVESGRVDAVCGPMISAPFIRHHAHFARPILYASFDIYVRAGDKRFDGGRMSLNRPEVKILSLDGSAGRYFANLYFDKAHQNSLPAMLGAGQILLDVKNGKADATVSEQLTAARFLDKNPGSLRQLRWNNQPLITLGLTPFVVKRDDPVWAATLDGILADLLDFGVIDKIFAAHHLAAGRHYQSITLPYEGKRGMP